MEMEPRHSFSPPPNTPIITELRGRGYVWLCERDVICTWFAGYAEIGFVTAFADLADSVLAHHSGLWVFHDWYEMTGYSSEARRCLVERTREAKRASLQVNLLVSSKLLAMGMAVARLAIPELHGFTDADAFDRCFLDSRHRYKSA